MTPFSEEDLEAAEAVALVHAPHIDLSVLFASLRERAGLEERERLAREMHDGIAQEMVAFGFGLDSVRRTSREQGSPLADDLDALREEVSRVLADLRLHIADLRIAVRPDTGLGAMIGARLQNFGSATGVTTRMHLSETGFRLPAHTEVLIYRLFLQVLADARHALDATSIEVRLNVAAPRVELWVSHNGTIYADPERTSRPPAQRPSVAKITVEPYGERRSRPPHAHAGPRRGSLCHAVQRKDPPALMTINVVVIDDHTLVREAVCRMIDSEPDLPWSARPGASPKAAPCWPRA